MGGGGRLGRPRTPRFFAYIVACLYCVAYRVASRVAFRAAFVKPPALRLYY